MEKYTFIVGSLIMLAANYFQVFPQGVDYVKMGGYRQLFADMQDKKELTKEQALKREPYLIAWGIITTITTIVLTVIQIFIK
jgi:hypothetical protein